MKKNIFKFLHYIAWPFVGFVFLINIIKILRKSRKYKKNPEKITLEKRLKYVYFLAKSFLFLLNIKIESENFNSIPNKPCLFVANHKSMLDAVICFKLLYEKNLNYFPVFVSKEETQKSNILNSILQIIDTIYIKRDSLRSVHEGFLMQNEFVSSKHRSIFIFPEGKRNYEDKMGEFLPASLKVAYQNFLPIVSISIYGTPGLFDSKIKSQNKSKIVYIKVSKIFNFNNYVNIKQEGLIFTIQQNIEYHYFKMKEMHSNNKKFLKKNNDDQ